MSDAVKSVVQAPVRVRIAPSPTGNLHVGTARTALFNYLFAKASGGKFILRIEDTDTERSLAQYTQNIYDSLKALGLSWDEGPDVGGEYAPYTQMERLSIYQEWADALLKAGFAYYSYETEAELEIAREAAKAAKTAYVYQAPSSEKLAEMSADPSRNRSLRFRIPRNASGEVNQLVLQDIIRGPIEFDLDLIGDFVIMKSNGVPTYNFAVVVDDALMRISHVIRGEDHISNTPKQILLHQAFATLKLSPVAMPAFAHVGMILSPDRSKLSKRHGATAVSEFIQQGYLPEAFCNFLSLLGWSAPDGQEVASLSHTASQFSLERIAHSPAIFDREKLNWLNKQYIRQLPLAELLERSKPYLKDFDLTQYDNTRLEMILDAVREPITTLADLPEAVIYFFGEKVIYDAQLVGDVLMTPEANQVLQAALTSWATRLDFSNPDALSVELKTFIAEQAPLKTKAVMWPLRVALSGRTSGADLSKLLYILGKDRVMTRLETALTLVSASFA